MTMHMDQTQLLRDRIQELEEELRQIKHDICPPNNPFVARLRLTPQEAALIWTLYNAPGVATNERMNIIAVEYSTRDTKDGFDATNSTKVRITNLRNKLRRYGVKIQNIYGVGYVIKPDSKKKLEKIMEKWK